MLRLRQGGLVRPGAHRLTWNNPRPAGERSSASAERLHRHGEDDIPSRSCDRIDSNKPQPWAWFAIYGTNHAVGLLIVAVVVAAWR